MPDTQLKVELELEELIARAHEEYPRGARAGEDKEAYVDRRVDEWIGQRGNYRG